MCFYIVTCVWSLSRSHSVAMLNNEHVGAHLWFCAVQSRMFESVSNISLDGK